MNNYNIDFTKLKPVNYNRKSTEAEDRQILSIDSQIESAEKISEFYQLSNFIDIFKESKSAKEDGKRQEFDKMMKMIESGDADTIVCWKLDRLARNMTEGGIIMDLLSKGIIKAVFTHDRPWYPWDNIIVMSVEFSQGKQFVKDLSVNVKRGQRKKASMGIPHGVAALGFLNDKSEEKGSRKWFVDELRFNLIKILFKMFLTGNYSAGKLYRYAVEELKLTTVKRKKLGGSLIVRSRIYEILQDPIYSGFFYQGDERYELDKLLPRMITEDEHNKVKRILNGKNISKFQNYETTYSGYLKSEENKFIGQDVKHQLICDCKNKFSYFSKTHCPNCGKAIEDLENPKYLFYTYYYNVFKKKNHEKYKNISETEITKKLVKFVDENLNFSKDLAEWSKKYIVELKDKEIEESIFKKQKQKADKEEFELKKTKLRKILRDEIITNEEYKTDLEILNKQYSVGSNYESSNVDWVFRMNEIVDLTLCTKKILEKGSIKAKRNVLSKLGSNLIWDDKNLLIYNDKAINTLVKGIKGIRDKNPEFEPKKLVVNKGLNRKIEFLNPVFSTLLRG